MCTLARATVMQQRVLSPAARATSADRSVPSARPVASRLTAATREQQRQCAKWQDLVSTVLLSNDLLSCVLRALGIAGFAEARLVCKFWLAVADATIASLSVLRLERSIPLQFGPTYLSNSPDGSLLVSEQRLQVLSPDGAILRTLSCSRARPWGIVCSDEAIFVAVSNLAGDGYSVDSCRLLKFSPTDFNCLSSLRLGRSQSSSALHHLNGPHIPGILRYQAHERYPDGLACAGNRLYLVDTRNDEIAILGTSPLGFVDAFGGSGSEPGRLRYPLGIACSADALYVVERDNHRVQAFRHDGTHSRLIGGEGTRPGRFQHPRGVAVGAAGLFVSEAARLTVLSLLGEPQQVVCFEPRAQLHGLHLHAERLYAADEGDRKLHVLLLRSAGA
uniref:Uncharacterized protein n=1 Tax=Chrysotila carterae TaxID=13221 RepID=A0A6S9QA15_CHRCT|mmetsp:Transcript_26854/g.59008  ORF Transcript_26854/g.59008 Transcript_26854/m.59008 type:complete len:390 (+) Transcript_26854:525-1694(+)